MKPPDAIYQELNNGRVHARNPDGKPQCFSRNYWYCHRSPAKWKRTNQAITCYHCLIFLEKLKKKAAAKQTLRELILPNGHC